MSNGEVRRPAVRRCIEPGERDERIVQDDFDDLLDSTSLGSPAARHIQGLTCRETVDRFQRRHAQAASAPAPLDIDDVVLALTRLCRMAGYTPVADHRARRKRWLKYWEMPRGDSDGHIEVHHDAQDALFKPLSESRRLAMQDLLNDGHGVWSVLFSAPGMEPIKRIAVRPGGAEKILQLLVDEGSEVVSELREDVARVIITEVFSHLDDAPAVLLRICAMILERQLNAQTLPDDPPGATDQACRIKPLPTELSLGRQVAQADVGNLNPHPPLLHLQGGSANRLSLDGRRLHVTRDVSSLMGEARPLIAICGDSRYGRSAVSIPLFRWLSSVSDHAPEIGMQLPPGRPSDDQGGPCWDGVREGRQVTAPFFEHVARLPQGASEAASPLWKDDLTIKRVRLAAFFGRRASLADLSNLMCYGHGWGKDRARFSTTGDRLDLSEMGNSLPSECWTDIAHLLPLIDRPFDQFTVTACAQQVFHSPWQPIENAHVRSLLSDLVNEMFAVLRKNDGESSDQPPDRLERYGTLIRYLMYSSVPLLNITVCAASTNEHVIFSQVPYDQVHYRRAFPAWRRWIDVTTPGPAVQQRERIRASRHTQRLVEAAADADGIAGRHQFIAAGLNDPNDRPAEHRRDEDGAQSMTDALMIRLGLADTYLTASSDPDLAGSPSSPTFRFAAFDRTSNINYLNDLNDHNEHADAGWVKIQEPIGRYEQMLIGGESVLSADHPTGKSAHRNLDYARIAMQLRGLRKRLVDRQSQDH
ncbi:hypothetical protein ABZV14_40965 [Streptosporangium canum]|uniref:hypothetical protein n=1 Tax=Streptosporangium canum TaxID=324952 RepID=UPI0033A946EB